MTKSKGVGRTGRPKNRPPGVGTPGTARTIKSGTVEAIEEMLALMAVENGKPNPHLGRKRSYSDSLDAHQKRTYHVLTTRKEVRLLLAS